MFEGGFITKIGSHDAHRLVSLRFLGNSCVTPNMPYRICTLMDLIVETKTIIIRPESLLVYNRNVRWSAVAKTVSMYLFYDKFDDKHK